MACIFKINCHKGERNSPLSNISTLTMCKSMSTAQFLRMPLDAVMYTGQLWDDRYANLLEYTIHIIMSKYIKTSCHNSQVYTIKNKDENKARNILVNQLRDLYKGLQNVFLFFWFHYLYTSPIIWEKLSTRNWEMIQSSNL
jgi:hypothetical protein